jgi:hypothetical protein
MDVLYESAISTIWTDDYSPILFTRLQGIPSDDKDYESLCEGSIKAQKMMSTIYKDVYSILDLKDCTHVDEEAKIRYCGAYLLLLTGERIKFIAVVKSKNQLIQSVIDEVINLRALPKIGTFDSFHAALNYLNEVRTSGLKKK